MKTLSQFIYEQIIDSLEMKFNNFISNIVSSVNQESFNKDTDAFKRFLEKPEIQRHINVRFDIDNQKETGYELQKNGLLLNIKNIKNDLTKLIKNNSSWKISDYDNNYIWFLGGLQILDIDFSAINEKDVIDDCKNYFKKDTDKEYISIFK